MSVVRQLPGEETDAAGRGCEPNVLGVVGQIVSLPPNET
jgi:hypothetical protein